MAITVSCDKCRLVVIGEVQRRGHIIKREYCDECVKEIDTMLAEIDSLHSNLAAQWHNELGTIRRKYTTEGGLLPDVSI